MVLFSFLSLPIKFPPLPKNYNSASGAVTVQLHFQALLKHLLKRFGFEKNTDKNKKKICICT